VTPLPSAQRPQAMPGRAPRPSPRSALSITASRQPSPPNRLPASTVTHRPEHRRHRRLPQSAQSPQEVRFRPVPTNRCQHYSRRSMPVFQDSAQVSEAFPIMSGITTCCRGPSGPVPISPRWRLRDSCRGGSRRIRRVLATPVMRPGEECRPSSMAFRTAGAWRIRRRCSAKRPGPKAGPGFLSVGCISRGWDALCLVQDTSWEVCDR
jgi:hypothetical protein